MPRREPDVRLYRTPASPIAYLLDCASCGQQIWSYDYALEYRHLVAVAAAARAHHCGVAA